MHASRRPLALPVAAFCMALSLAAHAQTVIATVPVGQYPSSLAVNETTNKVYVANANSNNVTVIDGRTYSTTTVPVGQYPSGVAVNSITDKIYVVNAHDSTVTVIDGLTNSTSTIPVGSFPMAIALNPVTNKIYVDNIGYLGDGTISVIDGATNAVTTVPVGSNGFNGSVFTGLLAVNPVTDKVYTVTSAGVTVIDGATNTTSTVAITPSPATLVVNPVSNKIYGARGGFPGSIYVIDGLSLQITTIPADIFNPGNMAVNTAMNKIYVTDGSALGADWGVTVVDGATNSITTLEPQAASAEAAVNPLTNKVYVSVVQVGITQNSGSVAIIDGATNAVTNVPRPGFPWAVAVNVATNVVYVTDVSYVAGTDTNTVTVVAGAPSDYSLFVSKGGNGTVTSGDGYIRCGTACSSPYNLGTNVFLTATPAAGSTFSSWSGCDTSQGNTCTVTVLSAQSVTANFSAVHIALSSLRFKPATVRGGQIAVGTLTLSAAAPSGGVTVGLTSSQPQTVYVPANIYIRPGQITASFAARVIAPRRQTVTVTAVAGSTPTSGNLTVVP